MATTAAPAEPVQVYLFVYGKLPFQGEHDQI